MYFRRFSTIRQHLRRGLSIPTRETQRLTWKCTCPRVSQRPFRLVVSPDLVVHSKINMPVDRYDQNVLRKLPLRGSLVPTAFGHASRASARTYAGRARTRFTYSSITEDFSSIGLCANIAKVVA